MMNPRSHFAALLLVAAAIPAQVTLPAGITGAARTRVSPWVFQDMANGHYQGFHAATEVGAKAVFKSLAVRQQWGNTSPAFSLSTTLRLDNSPTAYDKQSTTFSANLSKPTTVFSGTINLPKRGKPVVWPAPWEAPIGFSTSFAWLAPVGGSLVVDVATTTPKRGTSFWMAEGAVRGKLGTAASRKQVRSACARNSGNCTVAASFGSALAGGTWFLQYSRLPDTVPPQGASLLIVGARYTGKQFGLDLPVPLWKLGPLSFGCELGVSADLLVPMTFSKGSGYPAHCTGVLKSPRIALPATTPAGIKFYTQVLLDDPIQWLPLAYTTEVQEWTTGDLRLGPPVQASVLVEWQNVVKRQMYPGEAMTLRLQ